MRDAARRGAARAALVSALAVASFSHSSVAASEPSWLAQLACRAEAAPGRVLCELEVTPRGDARLTWLDALVTEAPAFARPLRARVAAERGADGTGERKLGLAFVATGLGVGQVRVTARSVVCRGPVARSACRPESRELTAELRVGS